MSRITHRPLRVTIFLSALLFAAWFFLLVGCHKAVLGTIAWQDFDGQRAFRHVEKLVALGPRPPASDASTQARQYLLDQLRALGLTVREQNFEAKTPRGPMRFRNLIAKIPGETGQILIIGAHYDTKFFTGMRFVGANDGGSATGALLEMARVLSKRPPAATVWLVFFDGEEALERWSDSDGLYGSRYFVEELKKTQQIAKVAAAIVLDMIGDKNLTVTIPPECSSTLVRAIFDAATAVGVREKFSYASQTITDDHTPFLFAGIPAIDVIDFEYGSRRGANDYWHSPEDTLDKVSAESLRLVGQVTLRALDVLAWRVASGERFKL